MTVPRINTAQAQELALAFVSDISEYIRTHEAEYLAYLERTGQADDSYRPSNTGAAGLVRGVIANDKRAFYILSIVQERSTKTACRVTT